MLSDDDLAAMLSDLECEQVERTSELKHDKDKVAQAICAFANDLPRSSRPGYVFIGVTDAGHATGTPITDRLLQDLAALRSDGKILPLPQMNVTKRVHEGHEIAVVEVIPSSDPPVRYEGRVWIRVGPRRGIASREDERALVERRQFGDASFDQHAPRGASIADLNLRTFEEIYLPSAVAPDILAENGRSLNHQLAALHLLNPEGRPNHAALLLLGLEPRRWLPSAYIQFLRLDGTDLIDSLIADQREIDGPIDESTSTTSACPTPPTTAIHVSQRD